jgi:hypothetical protein
LDLPTSVVLGQSIGIYSLAGSYGTLYADELSGSWNRNQLC